MKKFIKKHGKDIIILVDKSLKNPIVITGVSRFAKSRGVPYSEALLRLASLGLSKILAAIPEDVEEAVEHEISKDAKAKQKREPKRKELEVEELDAEELERSSSSDAKQEAKDAAKLSGDPKVEQRKESCVIG